MELIENLIRKEFERTRNKEIQLSCIAAAEEVFLNDLAEELKVEFRLIHE